MLQLDHSLKNFFKKCHVASDFLEMNGLFLTVYERRDKFWYVIKKGVQGKNNMIRIFYLVLFKNLRDMKS